MQIRKRYLQNTLQVIMSFPHLLAENAFIDCNSRFNLQAAKDQSKTKGD